MFSLLGMPSVFYLGVDFNHFIALTKPSCQLYYVLLLCEVKIYITTTGWFFRSGWVFSPAVLILLSHSLMVADDDTSDNFTDPRRRESAHATQASSWPSH